MTSTIPLLLTHGGDPVGQGFAQSLAHPGGNITGLSWISPFLGGKRLDLLKEAFPGVSRVALVSNPAYAERGKEISETQAARALGVEVQSVDLTEPSQFPAGFQAARDGRADALIVTMDMLTLINREQIAGLAAESRLPAMYGEQSFVTERRVWWCHSSREAIRWGNSMTRISDCFDELGQVTAAREGRFRNDPKAPAPIGPNTWLEVKVTSVGNLDELVQCEKSGHEFIISEPTYVGGRNIAAWPLEYLLGGAVGCFAAVFAFYAAKLGVKYDSFEATVRTELNVSGHMIPNSPSSGFQKVTIGIDVVSDEPIDRLREIEALAMAGCPGINTLRDPVPVSSELCVKSGAVALA